jgi:hypothetical protein
MIPVTALAQSGKKAARVNRMVFMFVPNGINMKMWTPATEGAFELTPTLAPLKNVKDSLTVLTGLSQNNAAALGDGGGDHARSAAAFLTGCHPRKTDGADIKNGISADQLAAMHVGNKTLFPSLEIGCERSGQSGNCDSGYSCAYSSNIAWRGEASPVAKELDPRLVFERLFSNGNPGDTKESIERRRIYRHSILDSVMQDAGQLKSRLGTHDQSKLDEYFSSVREIERRLEWAEKSNVAAKISADERPTGIPSDFGEHIRLLGDMMVLAFQADPYLHLHGPERRQQPLLQRDRRAGRASRLLAPRRQPGQTDQGTGDQPVPHDATGLHPGEDAVDQRAGRHPARQHHVCLRRRHQRR